MTDRSVTHSTFVVERTYAAPPARVFAAFADPAARCAWFDLQGGLKLAVWPRASIARDTGLPVQSPSATELTIGHNVNSRAEVDAVMARADRAGARIVKAAGDTFWGGYAGYFQDPDGHLWEVVWNPQLPVPE